MSSDKKTGSEQIVQSPLSLIHQAAGNPKSVEGISYEPANVKLGKGAKGPAFSSF